MIRLYDKDEKYFKNLGICSLEEAETCISSEELNGRFELELKYPVSGRNIKEIQENRIIYIDPNDSGVSARLSHAGYTYYQPFRIYSIERNISDYITVKAQHIFFDALGLPVAQLREDTSKNTRLSTLVDFLINNILGSCNIAYINPNATERYSNNWLINNKQQVYNPSTGEARYLVLTKGEDYLKTFLYNGTLYEETDDHPIRMYFNIIVDGNSFDPVVEKKYYSDKSMSLKDHLYKIIEFFKIDIYYDKWDIHLVERRGEIRNTKIKYGKNMIDMTNNVNVNNTYAGILPYYLGSAIVHNSSVKEIRKSYHLTSKEPFDYESIALKSGGIAISHGSYYNKTDNSGAKNIFYRWINENRFPPLNNYIVYLERYRKYWCWVDGYNNIKLNMAGHIKKIAPAPYDHCRIRRMKDVDNCAPYHYSCFEYYDADEQKWRVVDPTETGTTWTFDEDHMLFCDDYERAPGHENDPYDPNDEYAVYSNYSGPSGYNPLPIYGDYDRRGRCYYLNKRHDIFSGNEGNAEHGEEGVAVVGQCAYLARDVNPAQAGNPNNVFTFDYIKEYYVSPTNFKKRFIYVIGCAAGVSDEYKDHVNKIYIFNGTSWQEDEGWLKRLVNSILSTNNSTSAKEFIDLSRSATPGYSQIMYFEGHENDKYKKILNLDLSSEVKELVDSGQPSVATLEQATTKWLEKNSEKYSNPEVTVNTGVLKVDLPDTDYIFRPGDTVPIDFTLCNIYVEKRIMSMQYDCLTRSYNEIEIGDYDYEED